MTAYEIAARLPSIEVLRGRCQALAVLDLVAGSPAHSFTREWGPDEAALMTDGGGDEWAIVFTGAGAFIRVFDHESSMSPYAADDFELWPGLLDGLPPAFHEQLSEPAFQIEEQFIATAVLWREKNDDRWRAGAGISFPPLAGPYDTVGPDGARMLEILIGDPAEAFLAFLREYYEAEFDRAAVEHVVAHVPLTEGVVRALNPEADFEEVRAGAAAIGYPVA